jgi:fatty-acyl-CoA synthase
MSGERPDLESWQPRTLRDVLQASTAARGEAEAIVTDRKRFSYRQLHTAALTSAKALLAMGIGKGDHVAILMGNNAAWVRTFLGAALIGAVTVPVNTRFKAAELAFCLRQADVRALFLCDRFLGIDFVAFLREAEPAVDAALPGSALPLLRRVVVQGDDVPAGALEWKAVLGGGEAVDDATLEAAMRVVGPEDPLLIQFTSGTTAYPKGVLLTHHNMLRNAWSTGRRMGVTAEDRYFNCRPFYHVAGTTLSLLVALTYGATLVTLPTFEAGEALKMLADEHCTLTSGNDTLFQMMMSHADFDPAKLHLRGGWAAAGPKTMRKIIDVMGMKGVCAAYGLSECSPNVVFNDCREPEGFRVNGRALPHDGVEVRIADPGDNRPLPAGSQGEIQVRGWNVMRGYYNNPEANAKVFTPDGWLRTGDLGEMDAGGRLGMVGRLKDVFRVGGENVAPAEVEEVLQGHPAIATAQVIGVPDARLGEVPAAYVTLKAEADPDEIMAWCKTRMANFRVPRHVRVVADFEAIGMTGSGKVQKTKLREYALKDLGINT